MATIRPINQVLLDFQKDVMSGAWKTVRVFISSTFRDMHAERDHLVRFVFPRLREELLKRRIHLVDVDLRWGVTSDQDTLHACREIIDECRPRFLCILGGRYGWIPPGKSMSITAEEIHHGVLDHPSERRYAFFYFRDPAATAAIVEKSDGEYREPPGTDADRKLNDLKQAIVDAGLSPRVYPARWDEGQRRLVDLQSFGQLVYDDLMASITDQFGSVLPAEVNELGEITEEDEPMETFIEERLHGCFMGSRGPILQQMTEFIQADGKPNFFLLTGVPGSGKSTLLARLYRDILSTQRTSGEPPLVVIAHFVGTSAGSTALFLTLKRLARRLAQIINASETLPDDLYELIVKFRDLLSRVADKNRILIIIDALNLFDAGDGAASMNWLPWDLPDNVRIIASTAVSTHAEAQTGAGPNLLDLRAQSGQLEEARLPPLTRKDAKAIVQRVLKRYQKGMNREQLTALLAKPDCGNPLYLLVALEELRTLGTYEQITARIRELPGTTLELFSWILRVRLSGEPNLCDAAGRPVGLDLVFRIASLLGVSRRGLSPKELQELVEPGDPLGNVAALLRLLRPYLMWRGDLLDFFHGQFREAAESLYLAKEEKRIAANRTLAEFFQLKADPGGRRQWSGNYPRAFAEMAHHLFEARLYETLFDIAHDERFLSVQDKTGPAAPCPSVETIERAIRAAAITDDVAMMTAFSLRHAKRIRRQSQQSPLEVLTVENLARARAFAELTDPDHAALWHLLLAWALLESGRIEEAEVTLEMLAQRKLEELSDWWMQDMAAVALSRVAHICATQLDGLADRLLIPQRISKLCTLLCDRGLGKIAIDVARKGTLQKAWALSIMAAAQAQAGEITRAQATVQEIPVSASAFRIEALAAIAAAQSRGGEQSAARLTFAKALRTAEAEGEPLARVRRFASVAIAQAQAEDSEGAQQTLKHALMVVQEIRNPGARSDAYEVVAMAQALSGDIVTASTTADWTSTKTARQNVLCAIAGAMAEKGEFAQAMSMVGKIQHPDVHNKALQGIAIVQARVGKVAEALATAQRISKAAERHRALCAIAAAQVHTGDLYQALKTVEEIRDSDPWAWADALQTIATAQAQTGDDQGAERSLAEAVVAADEIESASSRAEVLVAIATTQAHLGSGKTARRTFAKALNLTDENAEAVARTESLAVIASVLAKSGDQSEAHRIITTALAAAQKIRPDLYHYAADDIAFRAIAATQAQLGDFAQALKTSERIGLQKVRAAALMIVATAQVQTEDREGARRTFIRAWTIALGLNNNELLKKIAAAQLQAGGVAHTLSTAKMIEPVEDRDTVLIAIVTVQLETGEIVQAMTTAERIQKEDFRAKALKMIASAQAQAGDREGALLTFAEALAAGLKIYASSREFYAQRARDQIRQDIASAQAEAGAFAQALLTAEEIKEDYPRAKILTMIAGAQAQAGDCDGAQQTLASMQPAMQKLHFDSQRELQWPMAKAYSHMGDFSRASAIASSIEDAYDRHRLLITIATTPLQTGDIAQVLINAKSIVEPFPRIKALSTIAAAQAKNGDYEGARQTFAEALASVKEIDGSFSRDDALLAIVAAQVEIEEFTQALATAERIKAAKTRAEALRTITMAHVEKGRIIEVIQVLNSLGAGDSTRREIAEALVEIGGTRELKMLLPTLARDLAATYRMCAVLAKLYPNKATAIVAAIESTIA